jgi:hypothetical protein
MVFLAALAFGFRVGVPYMRGMRQGIAILAVILLAATAAVGQEAEVPAEGAEAAGGVVARWQADHGAIFEASEVTLADLRYVARPVIVFADSPEQPEFQRQMRLVAADMGSLALRDVIVITDTDPAARSALRRELRPRGFNLVLIDKDGRVNLRKAEPWDVREISRQIDKMPLRQEEIRAGR